MDRSLYEQTRVLLRQSGFPCSDAEMADIAMLDFGLGNARAQGAQILTLCATDRLAVKLIVLAPGQVLPEHWHIAVGSVPAKQELLRVLWGQVDVYVGDAQRKVSLGVAAQIMIDPPTPHRLQAGAAGGVALCVSTAAFDDKDVFRNPLVRR